MRHRKELKVGIFWVVNGELIVDAVPLAKARENGSVIQHGSHWEYWQKFAPVTHEQVLLKSHNLDCYPRGRVVLLADTKRIVVYADRCVWTAKVLVQIQEAFGISYAFRFNADHHYHCQFCQRH